MAFFDLRRILMEMLSSPAMMEQAEVLRIQTQLEEIRRPLWAINAIMMDAELRTMLPKVVEEQDLDDWVADVGATLVDLEDLLASITDPQERAVESRRSLSRSSSFLGLLPRLAFRVAILRELKKMGRKLNDLVNKGSTFNLWREPMDSMDPLQDGYSAILKDVVKGRRAEYEEIMEHLQQQLREVEMDSTEEENSSDDIIEMEMHSATKDEEYSSAEMDAPFTIEIKGKEGMGKRTLARVIYHDEWVRQHFHHRVWVDASKFYFLDLEGIGREIARSMGHYIEVAPETSSFQDMWVLVNQRLAGRRYLLILDGFFLFTRRDYRHTSERMDAKEQWPKKWNELKRILLRVGGPGSTIIITVYGYAFDRIGELELRLEGISENEWTEIFMRRALAYQGPHQDKHKEQQEEEAEDMARTNAMQIYKRIYRWARLFQPNDAPLNAKSVGSVCRYIRISGWQEIVNNSDLLKNIFNRNHTNLIKLYFDPPRHAQTVFYHSLFDNDDIFLSEEFMHLIIAEGLLPLWSDKDVRLGYMDIIRQKYNYMLKHIKTPYYFIINLDKDSPIIPKQCRHLCLLFNSNASTISFPTLAQFKRNKLRTLILRCSREDAILKNPKYQILVISEKIFATLTHLRTLYLQASKIQHLPSAIGRLHNLRYLNLSCSEIYKLSKSLLNLQNLQILNLAHCRNLKKLSGQIHKLGRLKILKLAYCEKLQMLPATISNLRNLQELDLEGCPWLVQLPEGVSNMKSLVELNIHNCVSLTQMPRGIGKLINLLRLSGYHANDEFGSALAELQSLVNLRELRVEKLEQVWRSEEIVANLGLQKKTKLKYLTLRWQWWNEDLDSETRVDLEASTQQEELEVEVHPKASIEQQVQQLEDLQPYEPSLKKLEIISYTGNKCPSWMLDVSPFQSLREIRLINLKRCERLPPLVQLWLLEIIEISGMDSIVDVFRDDIPNGLKELTFSEMPKLEKLSMGFYFHFRNWFGELKIIHCPQFKALDIQDSRFEKLKLWLNNEMMFTSEFEGWENLSKVRELEIFGCQELKFLPQGIKNLYRLEKLTIISCNNLISLPDWMGGEFDYLLSLEICSCPALASIPAIPKRNLRRITIQGCPKLQLLSNLPSRLEQITIQGCPKLQQRLSNLGSWLEQITIQGCPKLQLPLDVPSHVRLQITR